MIDPKKENSRKNSRRSHNLTSEEKISLLKIEITKEFTFRDEDEALKDSPEYSRQASPDPMPFQQAVSDIIEEDDKTSHPGRASYNTLDRNYESVQFYEENIDDESYDIDIIEELFNPKKKQSITKDSNKGGTRSFTEETY